MDNPQSFFGWVAFIFRQYGPSFIQGAGVAVYLAFAGTILGSIIGFITGVVRTVPVSSHTTCLKKVLFEITNLLIRLYVWLLRGTPMMVQAMVIYYGAAQVFGLDLNPLTAGLFIVSINTGAYMSETVRGGIQSVDSGQFEGATAIGMPHLMAMRLVIIPQTFRNIIPQIGNYLISNIKDTSMLSVITVNELFYASRSAAGTYFRYFEVFFITCVIYLFLTTLTSALLNWLERRLAGQKNYDLA